MVTASALCRYGYQPFVEPYGVYLDFAAGPTDAAQEFVMGEAPTPAGDTAIDREHEAATGPPVQVQLRMRMLPSCARAAWSDRVSCGGVWAGRASRPRSLRGARAAPSAARVAMRAGAVKRSRTLALPVNAQAFALDELEPAEGDAAHAHFVPTATELGELKRQLDAEVMSLGARARERRLPCRLRTADRGAPPVQQAVPGVVRACGEDTARRAEEG